MNFTILMILLNTLFWLFLYFIGTPLITSAVPCRIRRRLYDCHRRFFRVSQREMTFYRHIGLPHWKDRLPQYNHDFDKRRLLKVSPEYLEQFIFVTCQAEIVHDIISVAGYGSLLFCLVCDDPLANLPLFFCIATLNVLCNIPFSMIQRYNRYRLLSVRERFVSRYEARIS